VTLADYQTYVNKLATLQDAIKGVDVDVRILNVRSSFNRIDVLVTPIAGNGETWVNANRVILKAEV
jgi:hypothetical protein